MGTIDVEPGRDSQPRAWDELRPELKRLDELLKRALAVMRRSQGAGAAADSFRGLHLGDEEVDQYLGRSPGEPGFAEGEWVPGDPARQRGALFDWLGRAFALSPFDLDVLLIALGPEVDLKYERVYAYLQDDVTRKRPSVNLALNLLCRTPEEKLARRAHFAAQAPLLRHGLLRLTAEPHQLDSPLLALAIGVDEQFVDVLTGRRVLDRRLAPFCRRLAPATQGSFWPEADRRLDAAQQLVEQARAEQRPLRLYLQGGRGMGQRQAAEFLAAAAGAPLLAADLAQVGELERMARILVREAWLHDAVLLLEGIDNLRGNEASWTALVAAMMESPCAVILAGAQPWPYGEGPPGLGPLGVLTIPFGSPDVPARAAWWGAWLEAVGVRLTPAELGTLAQRFRFGPGAIAEAVVSGIQRTRFRAASVRIDRRGETAAPSGDGRDRAGAAVPAPTLDDLSAAARAQTGQALATLTRRIEPVARWDDLVVPEDTLAQLRELCQRAVSRQRVLVEWGFGRKLSRGLGVNALFAGPSGTGKTMAAEVIANELGLDLYTIDLSGVISKWIGETEKNLDRIFRAAEDADAVLFFDEADALFGKRSEVRDSHDRYANIEISYLLQKMEQYEGVAILATNLRQNLDEAFTRRLAFTVIFPFPEVADRRRIWQVIWPAETPLGDDVDFDILARQFKLSGGQIKNITLAAAHLAAVEGGPVTMGYLRHATRREYQKLGKVLSDAELLGTTPGDGT
jgi:hypothetical protein